MEKEMIIEDEIHELWCEIVKKAEELEEEYEIDSREFVKRFSSELAIICRMGW